MSNALVSVIIPAYNAQAYLGQTIESVINQTYPHWEMLIVDDGSTDGTAEVIRNYLSDRRIKYLYQENQERAVARNHGIRCSSGQYIAFLDADDVWLPDKLKIQVEYLDTHPEVGLCFTHYTLMSSRGLSLGIPAIKFTPGKDQFYDLLGGNLIPNSTVMVPRFVLNEVGLFDETLPFFGCEDWDMWLRITRSYPIHFINQPCMFYRLHGSNTSLDKMYLSGEAVLQKIFSDPTLPSSVIKHKGKLYARFHFECAETCLRSNQRKAALKHWQRALQVCPGALVAIKRGWWVTLKLFLPYSLISNLPKLRLLLKTKRLLINSSPNK